MEKNNLKDGFKINQDNAVELSKELLSLLEALVDYKFIFNASASKKCLISLPATVTIKLNEKRTLICLGYNNNEYELENDSKVIEEKIYNNLRTILQNKRTVIEEDHWDESFKLAKHQILCYLIKENKLQEKEGFLKELQKFFDELPEVPNEFIDCSRELMAINFDDWDIEESEADDPRLKALEEIRKTMLASFELYKTMGQQYIEVKTTIEDRQKNENEESIGIKNADVNMFNVVKIPKDGNCFYSAVADQLKILNIKIPNNEAVNDEEAYYNHQDLRALTIDYIRKNRVKEFFRELEERLKAPNIDPFHGDLPSNIHTIDQYIEFHSKEEAWTDSGMVGALAQVLDITLRIYDLDGTPGIYNGSKDTDPVVKKIANLQHIDSHYNSLVSRPIFELLPFETKYPKQSYKIKRIFEILDKYDRGEKLDDVILKIGLKLGLSHKSIVKLKCYFNATKIIKTHRTINSVESGPWYTDDDMNSYGRVLEKHGVNFHTQFANRLTADGIKTLPPIESLTENHPKYISYNIEGTACKDNSGMHWVAIVLVKRGDVVTILYKDSKGDWNNSSETIANLFIAHYNGKIDFIKHSEVEQTDDASCGPMTINNLEIMALKVREAYDERKDGIAELIRLFKGESGGIAFTTQDEVQRIRISHLLLNKSYRKVNFKPDTNFDDLSTIISKLKLSDDDIVMKDGKSYNVELIKEDFNSFYYAVADQLRRLDIKVGNNETSNQSEAYYTHEALRELTIDYIKNNTDQEISQDIEGILRDPNIDILNGDILSTLTIRPSTMFHSEEGECSDSDGMIAALAQALNITIRIYYQDGMFKTYNTVHDAASSSKKFINLLEIGKHYNCLVEVNTDTISKKTQIETYTQMIDKYYYEVKDWGGSELENWSRQHKGQLSRNFSNNTDSDTICEAIAVMDRANELATGGHRLRDTQKVAILVFMQTNTKGHISQINTGEGKTTIVSVVQALKVMQGYKGHVITSNNILAADGVKDKKLFYDLLNITVADNNPDDKYINGPRPCYNKDIVYGSITSFQFDWLRDSFEQLKTLGGIDFNDIWVMLDEIDSLLIDQGSNIAKLSGPFPGMENLRYVYINIWVALAKTEEHVAQEIIENLKNKQHELAEDRTTPENLKKLKYIEYSCSLRESFLDEIKNQIKSQKNDLINKKVLATHLHQYAEDNLERWIEHAFSAKYQYKNNIEYKLSKDKNGENIITPVDNQNTGVSMKNTILSNGLHQFLQIKHNLCLTYESLTSCYVSNLDYIKKYGSKLSGVTGTLGSKPEKNLLGSVFNLEFSVIPPFKPKQFIQFPGKVSADNSFVNVIAVAALCEIARTQIDDENIKKPRAVLIVCASILDVKKISIEVDRVAKAAGLTPNILKYLDEIDAHITENELNTCDIVIATNLAGRGTDFKTSAELESNGGLHVIVAFLPCNKRVEDQGFGRTGRQGNKGTGQIIIKMNEVEALGIAANNNNRIDFDEIIKCRDELETMRLKNISDNKITELEFKGHLFNKFSSDYGQLKERNKIGTNVIKWILVLRDLKEKWAFWLEKQAYTAEKIQEIIEKQQSYFRNKEDYCLNAVKEEYEKFVEEAKPIINGTISHNPFYSICLAEKYLENSVAESDREKAKSELIHALNIGKSSELLYSAYIKLFEIAIEEGEQVLKRYKKAVEKIFGVFVGNTFPDYKKNATENLRKAGKALAIEYDYLEELIYVITPIIIGGEKDPKTIHNPQNKSNPNIFVKHLHARLVCLSAYKGNVESLIKQIKGKNEFENPRDSIGPNDGAIIDSKVPKYLSKLDAQNQLKKDITDGALNEFEYMGMSVVYQLRKIYDVHEKVITGARIQIFSALVLLATAESFPVLLPVNGPLAGAMISEAITDIITALLQQGQSSFNTEDYIKGKVISYGISLLTMGIGAIMSSTKILTKAMNVCRSLAGKLRAVTGPFARTCKFLARQLDKIAIYLEKMIEKIEFAKKIAAEQAKQLCQLKDVNKLKEFQKFQKSLKFSDVVLTPTQKIDSILKQAAIGATKSAIISVATDRIVIASLNNLMAKLQPLITEKVYDTVSSKIKCENENRTFNSVSDIEIDEIIKNLWETSLVEDIEHVSKKIANGVLKHYSNWKMQLANLVFDSLFSVVDIATCTNKVCNKFVTNVRKKTSTLAKNNVHNAEVIDGIITKLSVPISGILYGKIVGITGEGIVTLSVALYRGYQKHKDQKADEKDIADMKQKLNQIDNADDAAKAANTKCGHDAVSETLGLDKGSKPLADATNLAASIDGTSIENAKQLFLEIGIECTSCGVEDAQLQFKMQDSDRGVVCLSGAQLPGHMLAVTMEGNSLILIEDGQKIPLHQYKQRHGYTEAKCVIPKGVNLTSLKAIQHQCNLNRIRKATQKIDYVGRDDGMKFGGRAEYSVNADNIGKMKGHPKTKFLFAVTEGHRNISPNPSHPISDHVGLVGGKTSFETEPMQREKYDEVMKLMKIKNNPKLQITNTKTKEGTRQEIIAEVKNFYGYKNKKSRMFNHVTIVRDKSKDSHCFLVQTMYPCDKPQ